MYHYYYDNYYAKTRSQQCYTSERVVRSTNCLRSTAVTTVRLKVVVTHPCTRVFHRRKGRRRRRKQKCVRVCHSLESEMSFKLLKYYLPSTHTARVTESEYALAYARGRGFKHAYSYECVMIRWGDWG
jgi:hypothetical protein